MAGRIFRENSENNAQVNTRKNTLAEEQESNNIQYGIIRQRTALKGNTDDCVKWNATTNN